MPPPDRIYSTPAAFKRALDARLRNEAQRTGTSVVRLRQLLVFDRLLGRFDREFGSTVIAKGGVALELRLEQARTTRDLDLHMTGSPTGILERVQDVGRTELGDFLSFEIRETKSGEGTIAGDGAVYEGFRYRAQATMAGTIYAIPFGLDVAFGDVLTGTVDQMQGTSILDFIGAPRSNIRLYPRETHLAEKLHAYTLPRHRENSRVKDLPDIALLATSGPFDAGTVLGAFRRTFDFRGTHPVPATLPEPPASWVAPYARMAHDNALPWRTLPAVLEAASAFMNPVLAERSGTWNPAGWAWET